MMAGIAGPIAGKSRIVEPLWDKRQGDGLRRCRFRSGVEWPAPSCA